MGKIFGALVFRKKRGYVVVGKPGRLKSFDGPIHTRSIRINAKYCCILTCHWLISSVCFLNCYCLGLTSSWLVTLSAPAISAALASTAVFSSSDRTGPFSVTAPFSAMILTLWAYEDSDLSCTMDRRIFRAISRSG